MATDFRNVEKAGNMLMDTVRDIYATTKDARYLVPGSFFCIKFLFLNLFIFMILIRLFLLYLVLGGFEKQPLLALLVILIFYFYF